MRKTMYFLVVLWAGLWAVSGFGQNAGFGDIRGTVTDTSGAVVSNATVVVENIDTAVVHSFATNSAGIYDTSSIVPGSYRVTIKKDGYETFVRGPITVQAGFITVNTALKVGATQQEVVVSDEITMLKTESGDQSITLGNKTMTELPNVGQTWTNNVVLMPGAAGTISGSGGVQNPGVQMSINGAMPSFSNFLQDGASIIQPHSNNASTIQFDALAEIQVSTSSFSAEYGVGGVVFNEITKSGTKEFHGSAYEYIENDFFNAAKYNFGQPKTVPFQRHNQFGGSVGGPVLKKKLFFYFNAEKIIDHAASIGYVTVPTTSLLTGDFSGYTDSSGKQINIYDPTTTAYDPVSKQYVRSQFPNNRIPSSRVDPLAQRLLSYFPKQNVAGLSSNYYYNRVQPTSSMNYFGRLDYDMSSKNRLTFSVTNQDAVAVSGDIGICPINCTRSDNATQIYALADVWTISPSLLNQARLSLMNGRSNNDSATLGKNYPTTLGWTYAETNEFPTLSISGISSVLAPATNAVYRAVDFNPSDAVTWIRGKHIIRFGGELLAFQDNSTPWGNEYSGKFNFSGIYTEQTPGKSTDLSSSSAGLGFADFLLGDVQTWAANYLPSHHARQKTPQFYFQDDYKLNSNLTLNLGLRYQIQLPWTEINGYEGSFDASLFNPGSNSLGALWFALNQTNGRTNLMKAYYNIFLPRLGVAYQPDTKTTFRAGFGIYSYLESLDAYGNGIGYGVGSTGNGGDTTGGFTPYLQLGGNGTTQNGTPVPYISRTFTPQVYNGQGVSYTNYDMPVSRVLQWSVNVGRELTPNLVVNVSYIGSKGFNLDFYHDINQVPENKLQSGPTSAPSNTQALRPFPQYLNINGYDNMGLSNYNALQIVADKRLSHSLTFSANYTWSHMFDEFDQGGWGGVAGNQPYQRAHDIAANYGPSNFDIRNMAKGYFVYELPFGRGHRWLNGNTITDVIAGGWRASMTGVFQSGVPFTVLISGPNNSYALSGTWYPNVVGNPRIEKRDRTINNWFNTAAFAIPTSGTFGNEMRNGLLTSPGLKTTNASMRKSLHIGRELDLEVRADALNVFNHANFGLPGASFNAPGAGVIRSTTGNARIIQLGAHITF